MTTPVTTVALEIGSSTLKLGLARMSAPENNTATILETHLRSMDGAVRFGRIQNIDHVAQALAQALQHLEQTPAVAPGKITNLYVALGGRSFASVKARVALKFAADTPITAQTLERLEAQACQQAPQGKEIIDVIALRFLVDDLLTPRPLGAMGRRIAAEYTLIVCDPRNARNIETAVAAQPSLGISGYVLRPLAMANLYLSPDETKPGVMLADIGAETTTVAIFKDYNIQYLATIPLGSQHITADLAHGLGLSDPDAETLKTTTGILEATGATLTVEQVNANNFIRARATEIVANIAAHIGFAGYKTADLPAGIVLCGRGALLKNLPQMLQAQSHLSVRMARPLKNVTVENPEVAPAQILDLMALALSACQMAADDPSAPVCIKYPEGYKHHSTAKPDTQPAEQPQQQQQPAFTTPAYDPDSQSPSALGQDYDPFMAAPVNDPDDVVIPLDNDPADDQYLLSDHDNAEAQRQRDQQRKREKQEKLRRRREADLKKQQIKEERQRLKDEERAQRQPSAMKVALDSLLNRIVNIVSEPADETDFDDLDIKKP